MHSRICQIENAPVCEENRITEDAYIGDHWFTERIADYIDNDEDRDASLQRLKERLAAGAEHIEYFADDEVEGFVLREGFHTAYFAAEYEAFTKKLRDFCEKLSPESYADGSLNAAMFSLESAYDDEYGFYVDSDETSLVTLNRFLRCARPDTRYYFGGTVDYHF